jgi:hypothetical protein
LNFNRNSRSLRGFGTILSFQCCCCFLFKNPVKTLTETLQQNLELQT